MKHRRMSILPYVFATILTALLLTTEVAEAASLSLGAWSIASSPNGGSGNNSLSGVAAITPSNVWAVGNYYNNGSNLEQTLIEHWNGTSWSIVSSPNAGSNGNILLVVAVLAVPRGGGKLGVYAYAVGTYDVVSYNYNTLTESYYQ